ncbi:MAG: penicillin acylase family protein [Desulfobacterales bacterium]
MAIEAMKTMHYDLYSLQAEAFMTLIRPLLPDTENGRLLKNWDCRYDADSLGQRCLSAFTPLAWN